MEKFYNCFRYVQFMQDQDKGGVEKVDDDLKTKYIEHMQEKESVRETKKLAKERAATTDDFGAAIFDLQQVIYTPSGNHSEIFYRRRLANYNFTIYNLKNQEGYCQLWHEGIAKRGSCEIATGLLHHLEEEDNRERKCIYLFADGCAGQNKNSVIPCMLRTFLKTSKCVDEITVHFFEPNHGQSECDSMHSTIERNQKLACDIHTPAQLSVVVKTAKKKKPTYTVHELETCEIKD